jgi:hypothetical protein
MVKYLLLATTHGCLVPLVQVDLVRGDCKHKLLQALLVQQGQQAPRVQQVLRDKLEQQVLQDQLEQQV